MWLLGIWHDGEYSLFLYANYVQSMQIFYADVCTCVFVCVHVCVCETELCGHMTVGLILKDCAIEYSNMQL